MARRSTWPLTCIYIIEIGLSRSLPARVGSLSAVHWAFALVAGWRFCQRNLIKIGATQNFPGLARM